VQRCGKVEQRGRPRPCLVTLIAQAPGPKAHAAARARGFRFCGAELLVLWNADYVSRGRAYRELWDGAIRFGVVHGPRFLSAPIGSHPQGRAGLDPRTANIALANTMAQRTTAPPIYRSVRNQEHAPRDRLASRSGDGHDPATKTGPTCSVVACGSRDVESAQTSVRRPSLSKNPPEKKPQPR